MLKTTRKAPYGVPEDADGPRTGHILRVYGIRPEEKIAVVAAVEAVHEPSAVRFGKAPQIDPAVCPPVALDGIDHAAGNLVDEQGMRGCVPVFAPAVADVIAREEMKVVCDVIVTRAVVSALIDRAGRDIAHIQGKAPALAVSVPVVGRAAVHVKVLRAGRDRAGRAGDLGKIIPLRGLPDQGVRKIMFVPVGML